MYPNNPGYFQSTQPMMGQQPQYTQMQPMQPGMQQGMYQGSPNMMMGQSMSYDPAFAQNLIGAVQTALSQKGIAPDIANALLANINPANPVQAVQISIARLCAYAMQWLQANGKLVQGRPIRNEDLVNAVWRWVDESVTKIVANMTQQQAQQQGMYRQGATLVLVMVQCVRVLRSLVCILQARVLTRCSLSLLVVDMQQYLLVIREASLDIKVCLLRECSLLISSRGWAMMT